MPNTIDGGQLMKHIVSRFISLALATTGSVVLLGATTPAANAAPVATPYAFTAVGYGTLVRGGDLPAGSDKTAFRPIGCTNRAGLSGENHEAFSPLGGFGEVSGVATNVSTSKANGTFTSLAKNKTAAVSLGDPDLGSISIEGITSTSKAWKNGTGFHSSAVTTVAKISFAPAGMPAQELEIPTPGEPIEIPGLARISLGVHKTFEGANRAGAMADALVIDVFLTGSKVIVGHTAATIGGGITEGLFGGQSYATKVNALDSNLTSGPTPFTIMGCPGTRGLIVGKKLAKVNIADGVVVDGATSSQMGKQGAGFATGWERASVAEVNLSGGLIIKGIIGKANVTRKGGKVTSDITGTTIGSIVLDGEEMAFPDTDVLEIPGVAKLERSVVKRTLIGISVISLRITLLDGSGAVIDLGTAKLVIRASGR